MNKPTIAQIEVIVQHWAGVMKTSPRVYGSDIGIAVDVAYPGMTDAEFAEVSTLCNEFADKINAEKIIALWATETA